MLEELLSMFTDNLVPDSVIKWFRGRISYRSRVSKSKPISYEDFMDSLAELPTIKYKIIDKIRLYDAKVLLLVAYPIIDGEKKWQCTGIDKKDRYLFDIDFDVSNIGNFVLKEEYVYNVLC